LGGAGTTYYFKFSIWDSPTVGAGNRIWPLTVAATSTASVKQGVFTVNIGDTANGYPDALNSTELSVGEKILALADAFDAMTTDRPYRDKLGIDEAFGEVIKCGGTQFDGNLTGTFFNLLLKELSGEVKNPQILPHLRNTETSGFNMSGSGQDTIPADSSN